MIDVNVINSFGAEVSIGELPKVNGVYHLISASEFEALKKHFEGFVKFRKDQNQLETDVEKIRQLPFSRNDSAWKNKQNTLKLLQGHIKKSKPKTVLIIGSGNGWLCNQLSHSGLDCLGIGIMYYPYDGLETIEMYQNKFTHLLMHPHDLYKIKGKFDLIVFENNLPYVKEYKKVIAMAKEITADRGCIFLTGISIHLNGINKEKKRIAEMQRFFYEKYNHNINTYNTDMFLTSKALIEIDRLGFKVKFRPQIKNRIKRFIKYSVVNCDAKFTQTNSN